MTIAESYLAESQSLIITLAVTRLYIPMSYWAAYTAPVHFTEGTASCSYTNTAPNILCVITYDSSRFRYHVQSAGIHSSAKTQNWNRSQSLWWVLPRGQPTTPFKTLTSWTLYKMLIPRVMKGLEKSITFSRSEVMVKAATARSAFCRIERIGMEIVAQVRRNCIVVN